MRKHFLILMLLTLLPFTAWAADTNPSAIANLEYDGTAQTLVNAGAISEKAIWYAAVLDGASAPAKEAYVKATVSISN
jgi:hypothetical protein